MTNYVKSNGRIERKNSVLFHRYNWNLPEYKIINQTKVSSSLSKAIGEAISACVGGHTTEWRQAITRKIAKMNLTAGTFSERLISARKEMSRQFALRSARTSLREISVHIQTLIYFEQGAAMSGYSADRAGVGEKNHLYALRRENGCGSWVFTPAIRKDSK